MNENELVARLDRIGEQLTARNRERQMGITKLRYILTDTTNV